LIPSVVPEVPPAIAGMMCADMVPAEPVTECEAAIADAVAGP
jgi:hypothetical protein